ncbi:MAG: UDP-N-acetylglucosamine 1-carboxyvinyltransferase [Candidatus Moranbacteria bacterium]|nr:UDP-N-acetylglucosamine 1-carboxyvinyltransferase [Candidatus Moranbacteria bacterium]MBP6034266.1 UDP-N-acetylglucosamine 1-carboxyvinyltransferase [Candidatus Moranbacteria bacterium]MBP7695908.1 UDP-N-acetylglucosamine 1-carboxyvinyltransferase [Candidatus Moranbacteria bacterium]
MSGRNNSNVYRAAMDVFEIEGGKLLSGEIAVSGSKNATTPILAATLLTTETCVIHNVPRIEDVFRMLEILAGLGAEVAWRDERTVAITARDIDPKRLDAHLVKRLRSSILCLGSLSARFDLFEFYYPGGCSIGARPIDTHFDAFAKMGVTIVSDGEKQYRIDATKRVAGTVVLKEFSVTATENAMMLAAALPGKTIIKMAAAEPHVQDLGMFLAKMGAKVSGLGTHTITIEGGALHGAEHAIIPDANEAATFLVLGAATLSDIVVVNARIEHLEAVVEKLLEFGVGIEVLDENRIRVFPRSPLVTPGKVKPELYPGIPTDTQSLFGVLAAVSEGETLIHDHFYEGRFNYIPELEKMGVKAKVLNPHQAEIVGGEKLRGTTIKSFDLRAGAALIIAALSAQGKTTIEEIYQVDRGYERIEERLQKLGADIHRVERC